MSRVHVFEWEDQKWFPALFRNFITDHLVFHGSRTFVPAMSKLADAMKSTGYTSIVDLCSGGGGPIPNLLPELSKKIGQPVSATLTDLYPNIDAFKEIQAKNPEAIFSMILHYLRFCFYWLVALAILIFAQLRTGRWAKATLRRLELA